MSTGAGMPSGRAVAIRRKDSPNPEIGRPSAQISARPRATLIIPRVAMNGGRRPIVTKRPFSRPQAAALASASVSATGSPAPAWRRLARTIPASARTDPTERSIPPEMIDERHPGCNDGVDGALLEHVQQVRDGQKMGRQDPECERSARKGRAACRTGVPCWRQACPRSRGHSKGRVHDLGFRNVDLASNSAWIRPQPHHENPIAHAEDFRADPRKS